MSDRNASVETSLSVTGSPRAGCWPRGMFDALWRLRFRGQHKRGAPRMKHFPALLTGLTAGVIRNVFLYTIIELIVFIIVDIA